MQNKKVALVTGAGRGIGREIALTLAKEGMEVILNCCGSRNRAEEVKKEIEDLGGHAKVYPCDVSDFTACEKMCRELVQEY